MMTSCNLYEVGGYKKQFTLEQRKEKSLDITTRYPERVPVIVEYSHDMPSDYRSMPKQKYLIPREMKLSSFMLVLRKYIKLSKKKSLCLTSNGTLLKATLDLSQLYNLYKDDDGFLYITLFVESTFG